MDTTKAPKFISDSEADSYFGQAPKFISDNEADSYFGGTQQPDAIDTQIAELSRRGGTDYATGETKQKTRVEYQPIPYVSKIPYVGNVLNTASKGVMQTIQGVADTGADLAKGNFTDAGVNALRAGSGVADTVFSPIIGGFQTATNNPVGREAGDFLSKYVINPVANRISDDPNLQKFAVANPRAEQVFSDILNVGGSFVGGKKLPEIKTAVTKSTQGFKVPTIFQRAPESKVINNIEKELFDIENSYAKTRKAIDYSKDGLQDTRQRIAKTGILADAVDVDGVIRTTQKGGAIDKYTKMTLDDADGLVSNLLEREGGSVKPSVIEKYLNDAIDNSGLVGKALTNAKKNILEEIDGLKLKANLDGTIPLTEVHNFKIGTTKGIDYMTEPFVKTERKSLANGAQKIVEDISNENIKPINKELAKYLKDIEYLRNLDGRRVKGGRLGKYSAQISGNIIGAFTGALFGGPAGAAITSAVGGEVMSAIKGRSMKNVFNRGVSIPENQSPVIRGAIEKSQSPRLALPTPRDEFRSVKGSGATIELPAPDYSYNLGNRNTIYNTIPTNTINVINDIIHNTDVKVKDLPENFVDVTKDLPVEVKKDAFDALQEYNPEVFKEVKGVVETQNKARYDAYQEVKDKSMTEKMLDIIKNTPNKQGGKISLGGGNSYDDIAKALQNYDVMPVMVDGKLDMSTSNPDFKLMKLQEKLNSNKRFTDVDAAEAERILQKMGALPKPKTQGGYIKLGKSEELTTKILKDLEGKKTVSKQYILDATNRGELKQVERDLTRQVLDTMQGDKIDVAEFTQKMQSELLPLKVNGLKQGVTFKPSRTKYENIALPDELRGNVKDYSENIYESPIRTNAGNTHFVNQTDNYFGHTRIEDMADNKTRRVIEVQSDLYQKGNLEKETPNNWKQVLPQKEYYEADDLMQAMSDGKINKLEKARLKELSDKGQKLLAEKESGMKKLQQYNDPTAHFRMVREEIQKAAADGKTKLQFPTGETAMKIEGLGDANRTWTRLNEHGQVRRNDTQLTTQNLKVGEQVLDNADDKWIITDVLDNGKFKAVPKNIIENNTQDIFDLSKSGDVEDAITYMTHHSKDALEMHMETFDISGKVDTNNPIYKFYEKDMQKYLNKYGGKKVVDDKGVSWIEIPITKNMAEQKVEAFGKVLNNPLFIIGGTTAGAVLLNNAMSKKESK